MTGAAAQLARPVEPWLRQERAGSGPPPYRLARPVGQQIAEVARSSSSRGAPACTAHSALIVAAPASMRSDSRRPARWWWRWLRDGPWFCYRQLVAVLLRFGRRRTGRADLAALQWAFLGRACGCWGTWPFA